MYDISSRNYLLCLNLSVNNMCSMLKLACEIEELLRVEYQLSQDVFCQSVSQKINFTCEL